MDGTYPTSTATRIPTLVTEKMNGWHLPNINCYSQTHLDHRGNEWMALPAEIVKSLDLFELKTYKAAKLKCLESFLRVETGEKHTKVKNRYSSVIANIYR
jgi:hypothetical protein